MGLDTDEALAAAYRYLNRRDRTEVEMRAHLRRTVSDDEHVEQAIATLLDDGWLDDARFARLFVQDKRELGEWGSDRIRQTLLGRGIDAELVGVALADDGGDSEMERALALLRRRFPAPPADRRDRERALGVLLRKGFDTDVALEAIAAHARGADPFD